MGWRPLIGWLRRVWIEFTHVERLLVDMRLLNDAGGDQWRALSSWIERKLAELTVSPKPPLRQPNRERTMM